jgi:SPP1 family predicted phage head-tail adaptor
MAVRAGRLRHRIDLEAISSVPDGMGGSTDSWVAQATSVPADIVPVTATEAVRAGTSAMVGMHKVTIRYYAGLSAAWRVKFGSRYFSIAGIANVGERRVEMELMCREVIA